ncbi:hypothetical protein O7635_29360 [Asanoa sp. WMMD1127]|uniref:hypothetical protein n=1 Tax=Asanoa sp. WMMD1127 TaxID=3016107 RepID=UPI002415A68B|nr:hypothetical protein [Asanoa sp. WMMD1127]MDG4825977.1 hypothetical protein [Asanoa sp. WMMD1127]
MGVRDRIVTRCLAERMIGAACPNLWLSTLDIASTVSHNLSITHREGAHEGVSTMPARRVLPDNSVLVQLRHDGWQYSDIAAHYGTTENAVYLRLRQANAVKPRARHDDFIPWRVAKEHTYAHPALMLRYLAQREAGESPLPPAKSRMVDKWLRGIRENGLVLCYDREQPPNDASPKTGGFFYMRRRPEDGDNLIRPPELVEEIRASAGRHRGRG